MGAFLEKPKVDKYTEGGQGNGLKYALASMQGWRTEMEDAHTAVAALPAKGYDRWSFFAVFDGHAGAGVSAHCAEKLLHSIISNSDFPLARRRDDDSAATNNGSNNHGGNNKGDDGESVVAAAAATAVGVETEADLEQEVDAMTKAIRSGFLALDEQMRDLPDMISGKDKSGSTAICCLVSPSHMYFANCGDSRGVLCRSGEVALFTRDHKPANPAEKERIQRAGGSVMIQRVNGSLAVSRALGDFDYKQVEGMGQCEQLVSPEPEISVLPRDDPLDEFIVLACDGVWDVMNNLEVCQLVRHEMQLGTPLPEICSTIIDVSLHRGSRDNMSVVIVQLPGAPQPSEERRAQNQQLDATLENIVKDLLSRDPTMQFDDVLKCIAKDEVLESQFPPGGGLLAKRSLLQELHERYAPPSTPPTSLNSNGSATPVENNTTTTVPASTAT